ncbi:reverse transcriptase domain-containing protein [Tanacetum coccineum]
MQTRSSSKFVGEPSTNPTTTILKRRNRRHSIQRVEPFSLVETPVVTMADQRTMAELLHAPTEGYAEAIVVPPRSILTWDDLVSKFINHFFPPSKTINLQNEILNFQQLFDESFYEAWDRFKDLIRAWPHHGFTEVHQLDTFYNGLNPSDQDSLNSDAGGNLLEISAQDVLKIIENKSKVRNVLMNHFVRHGTVSRISFVHGEVGAAGVWGEVNGHFSSTPHSPEIAALVDVVKAMLHQKSSPPASVKAVEEFMLLVVDRILTTNVLPPMAMFF